MKKISFRFTRKLYIHSSYAVLIVAATTFLFILIGEDTLGKAVITLLYLVPIVWSTAHWGKGPGMSAALAAALFFDFFFIAPFANFAVGSLEGWLVLVIFLVVASAVVGPIQSSLLKAHASEREAILMYELSTILAAARTQEAVAYGVARFLHQRYPASLVTVSLQPKGQDLETAAYEPENAIMPARKPDCTLVILNGWGRAGEIHIWRGSIDLPNEDSRLFQDFTSQIGQALERTRLAKVEEVMNGVVMETTAKTK